VVSGLPAYPPAVLRRPTSRTEPHRPPGAAGYGSSLSLSRSPRMRARAAIDAFGASWLRGLLDLQHHRILAGGGWDVEAQNSAAAFADAHHEHGGGGGGVGVEGLLIEDAAQVIEAFEFEVDRAQAEVVVDRRGAVDGGVDLLNRRFICLAMLETEWPASLFSNTARSCSLGSTLGASVS
jgi:hypothetical protein